MVPPMVANRRGEKVAIALGVVNVTSAYTADPRVIGHGLVVHPRTCTLVGGAIPAPINSPKIHYLLILIMKS